MGLESKNDNEVKAINDRIESKINEVLDEINRNFKFKGNTLKKLLNFKLDVEKKEIAQNSSEYRNALIAEIGKRVDSGDISLKSENKLSQAEYEVLASRIIEINKLSKEVQTGIQSLKKELLDDSSVESILSSSSLITKRLYPESVLEKIDDPKNLQGQLLGLLVAGIETVTVVSKFLYDLSKDIVLSPYHLVKVIRGKARYDGIEI